MTEETWKDVDGFSSYQVSDQGRVRNKKTCEVKKIYADTDGYLKATLIDVNDNKKCHRKSVHRLVAKAFIDGDHELQVNHINGIKTDNRASNLEWATCSENVKHAYDSGLRKPSGGRGKIRPIRVIETGRIYENEHECAKAIGSDSGNVSKHLHGQFKVVKGYHLEYADKHISSKKPFLYDYQMNAVKNMRNGCILNGGVGSGKSRTGLYYYFEENGGSIDPDYIPMKNPQDLYIITTAKKRDSMEWEQELTHYLMSTNPEANLYNNKIIVDSWNNIGKYSDVRNGFFLLDEQRVVGSGAWVKAFLKIAKNNNWVLLTATAGDTWSDFIPVFVANGFYKNKTEFIREHVIYSRFTKYPKVDRYVNTNRLIRLRNRILVDMEFERHTVPHHEDVYVNYDISTYKDLMRNRWNIWKDEPFKTANELCYALRRIVNSSDSRQIAVMEIFEKHPKVIIFYNFDYELDILKNIYYGENVTIAEWNGHAHQPLPDGDRWVYLVQYTAGCEGWNAITTDTIIFYSQNYSYKVMAQASGRIDRLNTPYTDLYYYHLKSRSGIDLAISRALKEKKQFNERKFTKWQD